MRCPSYISADTLLSAYKRGIFPMADGANSEKIFWIKPDKRGIIPLGNLHISRSTKKFIRKHKIVSTINSNFSEVLTNCRNRKETWINYQLYQSYLELNRLGYAISVEIWIKDRLIGGLLGVIIGACFFGESMFSLVPNGSKLALICTMARLVYGQFSVFDTQFLTDHLRSMGGREISHKFYLELLAKGLDHKGNFLDFPVCYSWESMIQLSSQNR